MYPQGRCVYVPTRDPTSRADFEQVDELWTPVTITNNYLLILTYEDGCHSCELKNTLAMLLAVSCTHMVGVSICQPGTQRHAWILNKGVNYGPMHVTTSNKYLQIKMDVILVSCNTH